MEVKNYGSQEAKQTFVIPETKFLYQNLTDSLSIQPDLEESSSLCCFTEKEWLQVSSGNPPQSFIRNKSTEKGNAI
jgi:hypothetical protein